VKPNRLEELRRILLRPDHEKLEALRARVERAEQRAADVAEVLPDSVAASVRQDSRLIGALRTPLRQCVSESVREDPEEYADALFPIMGPAIRRAVAEAFKAWIQQANQAIEQSLSPRGLSWRFQAWRAGIPFGQYVLQRTLLYRVEHVYLIQSSSGLLIGHVQQGEAVSKDEDAVSAMFTAIQEFVKDSFSREEPQRLRTAELGELTLWAVHGPAATIVAVIRGVPPATLRTELEAALELIETRHSGALRAYAGDRASMAHLAAELRPCLLVSLRDPEPHPAGRKLSPALALLTMLAVLAVGWLGYAAWMQSRLQRVAEALEGSPGIVVTHLERDGNTLVVRGLRDPLAAPPEALAAAAGWTGGLDSTFRPFLSLEPELVLERAKAALAPPATVSLQLTDGTLHLRGQAPTAWIGTIGPAAKAIAGVDGVDLTSLRAGAGPERGESAAAGDPLAKLKSILNPRPETELALNGSVLILSGEASKAWLDAAIGSAALPGVESIDYSALVLSEQQAMQTIADEANGFSIRFSQNEVAPSQQTDAAVARLAETLMEYGALARALELEPRLTITGHSDDSGSVPLNISLERRRAEDLAARLRDAGAEIGWITTRSQLESGAPGSRIPQVTLHLQASSDAADSARD
jgi:OOP family OmpA-OmpF porin